MGQNLGAKSPERAEKAVWRIAAINMMFMGIICVLFISLPGFFVSLLANDADMIELGIPALRIISYGFVFYGLGMVLVQSFNGAGDTRTPTLVNLIAFWIVEIPLAYFLSNHTVLKEQGVYYSIIIVITSYSIHYTKLYDKQVKEQEKCRGLSI